MCSDRKNVGLRFFSRNTNIRFDHHKCLHSVVRAVNANMFVSSVQLFYFTSHVNTYVVLIITDPTCDIVQTLRVLASSVVFVCLIGVVIFNIHYIHRCGPNKYQSYLFSL